ncbi:hypothetical protein [Listeria booriae]|uniref:hypothetical protein n=1 Tax=Listeria booriae TaxID=1552123 RepID=UPI001623F7B2|nr:hypothetical protein [Listeria booriae]MBC2106138.1 hypothetical protein [Listeria booriae]
MLLILNGNEYDSVVIERMQSDDNGYKEVRGDVYKEFVRIRYVTTRNSCRKVTTEVLKTKLHPFLLKKHLNLSHDEALKIIELAQKFYGKILD